MAEQITKRRPRREKPADEQLSPSETSPATEQNLGAAATRPTIADIDALLNEIDEVLEEDPEALVKNYIQMPGQ
ncbi:MAG: ubiquitin-like protein Pup [Candidatus Saccharimonadales bacterium]